jgi:hypothetical protein
VIFDVLESMDVMEEYIDSWFGSLSCGTCSAEKETVLETLGVEGREGMGVVERNDAAEKTREGGTTRSLSVEKVISSCEEIKTNEAFAQSNSV